MSKSQDGEKQQRQAGGYPYYTLSASLNLADVVARCGGSDVPKSLIASELKADEGSSAFAQLCSSSKCFGIVSGVRTLSLTELGHDYFFPTSETERDAAKLAFFGQPPVFAELIRRFDGRRLPASALLTNLIQREKLAPPSWAGRAASLFLNSAAEAEVIDSGGFLRYEAATHLAPTRQPQVAEVPIGGLRLNAPERNTAQVIQGVTSPRPRMDAEQAAVPTTRTATSNVWTFSEAGGTVRLETSDPLPKPLWDRLTKYVKMLEPANSDTASRQKTVDEQLAEL